MEQGSYLLITPGMVVHSRAGASLGSVVEVAGDATVDIFRGILVSPGLLRANFFIAQDRIISVTDDGVLVDVEPSEVEHLPLGDQTIG